MSAISDGYGDAQSLAKATDDLDDFGSSMPDSGPALATKVWSSEGVREMLGTLKPSDVTHDLVDTFARVRTIGRSTAPTDSVRITGAIIGDLDSVKDLVNLDKAAASGLNDAAFTTAHASARHALTAVGGAIALDDAVLGASTEYTIFGPQDPVAALELDH